MDLTLPEKVVRLSTMPEINHLKNARERWTRVTRITHDGISVIVQDDKDAYLRLFVPFTQYPQLLQATIEQVFDVDNHIPGKLSWPQLSINIPMETLVNPADLFPTVD